MLGPSPFQGGCKDGELATKNPSPELLQTQLKAHVRDTPVCSRDIPANPPPSPERGIRSCTPKASAVPINQRNPLERCAARKTSRRLDTLRATRSARCRGVREQLCPGVSQRQRCPCRCQTETAPLLSRTQHPPGRQCRATSAKRPLLATPALGLGFTSFSQGEVTAVPTDHAPRRDETQRRARCHLKPPVLRIRSRTRLQGAQCGDEQGMLSWRDSLATSFSRWSHAGALPAPPLLFPSRPARSHPLAAGRVTAAAGRKEAGNGSDLKTASPLFRCKFSNCTSKPHPVQLQLAFPPARLRTLQSFC